jgi:hypothetical protein
MSVSVSKQCSMRTFSSPMRHKGRSGEYGSYLSSMDCSHLRPQLPPLSFMRLSPLPNTAPVSMSAEIAAIQIPGIRTSRFRQSNSTVHRGQCAAACSVSISFF